MSLAGDGLAGEDAERPWFGVMGVKHGGRTRPPSHSPSIRGCPTSRNSRFRIQRPGRGSGVAQNETDLSPRRCCFFAAWPWPQISLLSPTGRGQSLPQAPTEAKIVESQAIAAAPAPEQIPNAPPSPPPSGDQGSDPQASQPPQTQPAAPAPVASPADPPHPPSSTPAASKNVPKGKGVGWSRAPGKTKKASEPVLDASTASRT